MSGDTRGRRNWTLSITLVFSLAAVAAAIGVSAPAPEGGSERFYLNNSGGPVLFDHGKHSEAAESCGSCHHDLLSSAAEIACSQCHGDDVAPEDLDHDEMKELHGYTCTTCHMEENDTPSSCRSCHPGAQPSDLRVVGCTECHEEGYDQEMLSHTELLEIEEHDCMGCHRPTSLSETYHSSCTPCHLESSPERFADAGGEIVCGACHLE